jgi:hypothetical protein
MGSSGFNGHGRAFAANKKAAGSNDPADEINSDQGWPTIFARWS